MFLFNVSNNNTKSYSYSRFENNCRSCDRVGEEPAGRYNLDPVRPLRVRPARPSGTSSKLI